MSISWATGLSTQPSRCWQWLRRLFYRPEHARPLDQERAELQLPCRDPGSFAKARELPWWADLDAEPVRIWPELDLLSVERFVDRLFGPLERQWAS